MTKPGQIGIQPRHQARGDDRAGHQLVGRGGHLQPVRIVDVLLRSGFQKRQFARLVRGAGSQQIDIATGERERTIGGSQRRQRRQAAVGCRWRRARDRIGSRLGRDGLLRRGLQLQPEQDRALPGLAGQAREAGLLRALGLGGRIASGIRQFRDAGRKGRGWGLLRSLGLLVRPHAVIGGGQLGQGIGDGLVVDIEELLAVADAERWRLERHQHDAGDEKQQYRRTADDHLAVDARDRLRARPQLERLRRGLGPRLGWSVLIGCRHCFVSRQTASVRTMRTTRCGAVPSLSSAAANSRSTM